MIRVLVTVLVLAFLADSAFGEIDNLLRAIGLGGPRVHLPIAGRYPGSGFSWTSPVGDGYVGYGFGR